MYSILLLVSVKLRIWMLNIAKKIHVTCSVATGCSAEQASSSCPASSAVAHSISQTSLTQVHPGPSQTSLTNSSISSAPVPEQLRLSSPSALPFPGRFGAAPSRAYAEAALMLQVNGIAYLCGIEALKGH